MKYIDVLTRMNDGWSLTCGLDGWVLTRGQVTESVSYEAARELLDNDLIHLVHIGHGEYFMTTRGCIEVDTRLTWLQKTGLALFVVIAIAMLCMAIGGTGYLLFLR